MSFLSSYEVHDFGDSGFPFSGFPFPFSFGDDIDA